MKILKTRRIYRAFCVVTIVIALGVVFSSKTYAMSKNDIYKKNLANLISGCYSEKFRNNVPYSGGVGSYVEDGPDSLISTVMPYAYLPNFSNIDYMTRYDNGKVTCRDVFFGKNDKSNKFAGVFEVYDKMPPNSNSGYDAISDYMKNVLLYRVVDDVTNTAMKRIRLAINNNRGGGFVEIGNDGVVLNGEKQFIVGGEADDGSTCTMVPISDGSNTTWCAWVGEPSAAVGVESSLFVYWFVWRDEYSGNGPLQPVEEPISGDGEKILNIGDSTNFSIKYTVASDTAKVFHKGGGNGLGVVKNITGVGREAFTTEEKWSLYIDYLSDYYGFTGIFEDMCTSTKPSTLYDTSNGGKAYIYDSGKGWCPIAYDANMGEDKHAMNVFADGDDFYLMKQINSLNELINIMGELGDTAEGDENVVIGTDIDEYENAREADDAACYSGNALGWVMCPVIAALKGVSQYMWEKVEPELQMKSSIIGDGVVERVWGTIRNYANTVFVILFIVVIFAQLTGLGIDNYGIKKILPRLIMVAVLMNLSLILCKVAVDISNIVGYGAQELFGSIFIPANSEATNIVSNLTSGIPWFVGIGIGSAIGIFASGGVLAFGAAAGIALLGLLITAVFAMLVLYIMVSVRQAGVILAIVTAPLAIVCYALPNTEKITKKWFEIFKALLLVYPICGIMLGASLFAGKLLGNAGSTVPAMLVQIVPLFFIPAALRNSLKGLGDIGGKISSFGRNLGRRASGAATGAIRNSERFKDWQNSQRESFARRRAEHTAQRLGSRTELSDRQLERLRKARETILANENKRDENRLWADQGYVDYQRQTNANAIAQKRAQGQVGTFKLTDTVAKSRAEAARNAAEFKAYQDQYANYNKNELMGELFDGNGNVNESSFNNIINSDGGTQRLSALFKAMESNGMENDIFKVLRNDNISRQISKNSGIMAAFKGSDNILLKAYGKKAEELDESKTGNSFMDFMNGGLAQEYIKDKGKDFIEKADDKVFKQLAQINPSLLTTDMLLHAACTNKKQDAINVVNDMLKSRGDISKFLSAEELVKMNDTTYEALLREPEGKTAIGQVIKDLKKNPNLITNLSSGRKQSLNNKFNAGL